MPMLKTITGHTGCAGVMDYLRKGSKDDRRKRRMGEISEADTLRVAAKGIAGYLHDGHGAEFDRALAEDFVGIPPSAQGDWARYMDDLRRAAGCDRRTGGREGKAVTYRHYVLAPDPEDGIDLDTLRAYAKEWVVKAFGPGATAAIVYHDDNHERLKKGLQGIPHAHICINALNTQTGRKWHFAKDDLARQANVAQELAEKYSLAPLPKMRTSDAREDPLKTMRICRTKEECAMLAKGFVPYKESIRKAVAKACRTASSWDQFKAALADKGVSVTITRRGTLTYCDSNGRKAKEQKLGLNFGIVAVGEAIKRNSSESVSLPDVDATPATYDVSLVRSGEGRVPSRHREARMARGGGIPLAAPRQHQVARARGQGQGDLRDSRRRIVLPHPLASQPAARRSRQEPGSGRRPDPVRDKERHVRPSRYRPRVRAQAHRRRSGAVVFRVAAEAGPPARRGQH